MESTTPTLGLLADPGMPERLANNIADSVAERIHRDIGERWTVEVSGETLPLAPDGNIHLLDHAPALRRRHNWDYVVYLTDLPRYVADSPMLCEVTSTQGAALISVPVLGVARLEARACALVVVLVRAAAGATDEPPDPTGVEAAVGRAHVRLTSSSGDDDLVPVVLQGRFIPLRMLGGMVRSNEPGSLLPALTGVIATAVATGAFGVFYGTIAGLADALPSLRLALVSVAAVCALTAWLILRNKLWNRGRDAGEIWQHRLDNASTAVTVGVSVAAMYLILFVVLLVMSLIVMEAGYLRSQIMHPVGFIDYVNLAWLAASLGTMAGAFGANFDREEAVRGATYSSRYHERRKLFDTYEQDDKAG